MQKSPILREDDYIRQQLVNIISEINDTWILKQILRYACNITKEEQ